ncbi:MAG: DNRLRE domain-containing protein [Bacteroidetes bacterium]|nr:DNRLRE domain-containing protein [Bacteroidota bacterium]
MHKHVATYIFSGIGRSILLILVCIYGGLIGQNTTLVFQPDSACGKDALLTTLAPYGNYGNHPDFLATAWTNSGVPVTCRSLIAFDLTGILPGTNVIHASLELFHYNSSANVGHSTLSGPNDATLYRVTTNWNEHTVCWNTQPSHTPVNSVLIPASSSSTQNYTLNVTSLVQDMINDPANSYGFMFMENTESYYRSMLFASSDESNPLLHPRLTIILSGAVNVNGSCITSGASNGSVPSVNENALDIPNTFTPNHDGVNDAYYLTATGYQDYEMKIYNRWGTLLKTLTPDNPLWDGKSSGGEECPDGTYFYTLDLQWQSGTRISKRGYISLFGNK